MAKKLTPVMLLFGSVLFFFIDCFCVSASLKRISILLLAAAVSVVFLFYSKLRDQVRPPLIAVSLMVLLDGVSCFYAVAPGYALTEFLRILASFCLALSLLAFCTDGRQIAVVLTGAAALSSVVSIDMLATRLISTPILDYLGQVSGDYQNLPGVEPGIRLTSMFLNPNVFAGFIGIAVLMGLGLAVSSENSRERAVHIVLLFINSLAFVLSFSMGAIAAIVLAFAVYLLLEQKGRRIRLLLLMAETLIVTLLMAFPISITSFSEWNGVRPVPLVCMVLGALMLCLLDYFVGCPLAARLNGKAIAGAAAVLAAAAAVFFVAAFQWTDGISLGQGETLRRADYPEPGAYQMVAETDGAVHIMIETQNRIDTVMHTSMVLYEGALDGAAFTVPDDSTIVYFNFTAEEAVRLERVAYGNEQGSASLPLKYRLLPGFIANRLQGLWANQNAIQRFSFFENGMKLFLRSPVIGSGLGAYENGLFSVQDFFYSTRYAHNHYIQSLVDTGIIGGLVFIGMLAVLAAAVWFGRRQGVLLAPALGGALAFLAGHVLTEMVFSTYTYLPMAFGMFAAINDCCGSALPMLKPLRESRIRAGILLSWTALLFVFGIFLGMNVAAQNIAAGGEPADYEEAARLDRFQWQKHLENYLYYTIDYDTDDETRQKADRYAERLERKGSYSAPYCLTEYYLATGRTEKAMEMAKQYVVYQASNHFAWQDLLDVMEVYEQNTPVFREGVAELARMREEWNKNNLGTITLTEQNEAFIARMQGTGA